MSKSGNRLVDVLPRAGLVTTEPFLGVIRHDASFFKNLQTDQVIAGGYIEAYGERSERRARLDAELATMMDVASKEDVRACLHPSLNTTIGTATAAAVEDSDMADLATIDNNNHLLRLLGYEISDELPAPSTTQGGANEQDAKAIDDGQFFHYTANIKKELPWAEGLTTSLFNTLFCNVLQARVAWNANPRPPFNEAKQSSTAKAAQRLLEETVGTEGGFLSDGEDSDNESEGVEKAKAKTKESFEENDEENEAAQVARGVQKMTLYGDVMDLDE